jgi:hypothetical protein
MKILQRTEIKKYCIKSFIKENLPIPLKENLKDEPIFFLKATKKKLALSKTALHANNSVC